MEDEKRGDVRCVRKRSRVGRTKSEQENERDA